MNTCMLSVADPGIFKTWGGLGPSAVEFLRSGDCFGAPSHILYVFVVSVENEIHIVNIVTMLTTINPKIFKRACAPVAPVLDLPLVVLC